ncbi:MAG: PhnD/SsuA/transferrin family substrate-binding protein [Sneathiella sp.]
MTNKFISLPMYDWPELHAFNDLFFTQLKESFKEQKLEVSDKLDRNREERASWQDKDLLLSQTCGLPFVTFLKGKVSLVGTPAYGIDCGAGSYYSVIVVRKDSDFRSLEDLKGKTFAYNEKGSQSGYAALLHTLSSIQDAPKHFSSSVQSGGHRASVKMVADGTADFAAIDAVSWEMAKRHEKAAEKLGVIAFSKPTPALPFITSLCSAREIEKRHMAVVNAMASLNETVREALLLMGFMPTTVRDYRIIETRLKATQKIFSEKYWI